MKKIGGFIGTLIRIVWIVAALVVFIGGLLNFLDDKSIGNYLLWGIGCAIVCIVHLVIDYFSVDRKNAWYTSWGYIALSIVLGPVLLILSVLSTLSHLGKKKGKSKEDDGYKDSRRKDVQYCVLEDTVEKAIRKADFPTGAYFSIYSKKIRCIVTSGQISVKGTITYNIIESDASQSTYEMTLRNCLVTTQNQIGTIVENAVDEVRKSHSGYDGDWNISVEIEPEFHD